MRGTNNRNNQRSERGGSPRHFNAESVSARNNSVNKNPRAVNTGANERVLNSREIYRLNDLYERGSI
jgi:hypothetical protein